MFLTDLEEQENVLLAEVQQLQAVHDYELGTAGVTQQQYEVNPNAQQLQAQQVTISSLLSQARVKVSTKWAKCTFRYFILHRTSSLLA